MNKAMAVIETPAHQLAAGMSVILPGRKQPVEILMIDNYANADRYQIGHYGKGFNVTSVAKDAKVKVVAA